MSDTMPDGWIERQFEEERRIRAALPASLLGAIGGADAVAPASPESGEPPRAMVGCCPVCGAPPSVERVIAPRTGYLAVRPACECNEGANLWPAPSPSSGAGEETPALRAILEMADRKAMEAGYYGEQDDFAIAVADLARAALHAAEVSRAERTQ